MHESHCNVQTKHGPGERACRLCKYTVSRLVLCIGSNMGLKLGRKRPIRVLSPCFAHPNIRKETNLIVTNLYLILFENIFVSVS